jgi:hypothetical protein
MKKKLRFTSLISARPAAVWDVMLQPATYRDWAAEFAEGCYYEGSWDEGAKIRFLSSDGQGMVARIAENRPHEFLSIEHQGFIKDGVEDTTSEAVRAWTPAFENYSFRDVGGATELAVELDMAEEWEDDMSKMWPKALARLKALCESRKA